ncbi:MAG: GTP-binding protein [Succinivibrio sp.]|nr:GTP-binding protein [Succinivibrio sp.]
MTDIVEQDRRIPVNIITGFLGSGKTTLLNHWVNTPEFKDTLVLINEFGDVGLDHELVQSVDDTVVLLGSGCICCSLQGALIDCLANNLVKAQQGLIPNFKRVLIETTGLADPAGVIATLNGDEYLIENFYYDGTVTVLDAQFIRDQLKKQYEAVKQIALADLILISKTDLVDADDLDPIYDIAGKINPNSKIYPMIKGNITPKLLFDIGPYKNSEQDYETQVKSWLNIKAPLASSFRPASLQGAVGVAKPRIIAHTDVDSFALEHDDPIDPLALLAAIGNVSDVYGDSILRIKGILNLKGQDKPVIVHAVMGNLYPLAEMKAWPEGKPCSKLVFICRASVMEQIKTMFDEMISHPDQGTLDYYQQMIDNIEQPQEQ